MFGNDFSEEDCINDLNRVIKKLGYELSNNITHADRMIIDSCVNIINGIVMDLESGDDDGDV